MRDVCKCYMKSRWGSVTDPTGHRKRGNAHEKPVLMLVKQGKREVLRKWG
jgi:hypothetical protein